ncbi:MAG: glycosyltransferase [Alphaproteobacteria bacterium]|nr:glycosyltransferase [Alphaproteobacteria bacterium]
MMATLSLAMIVKNEGATIERVLKCAKNFCDEMIVVDTGSTDDTVEKAKASGAIVHHFAWIDDFAAARNFSFSKCSCDWIIWLDGDDIVTPENQKMIADLKTTTLDNELEGVYLRYIYPPFVQWRERMIRRNLFGSKIEWREPIHECIHGIDAAKQKFFDTIFIKHDPPPERAATKKDRNITILRKHIENGANDERTLFMYAIECLHSRYLEEAERMLETFFAQVHHPHYRYEVYYKMYDLYMSFNMPEKALAALPKGIAEDPARAEAYYRMGKYFMEKVDNLQGARALLTTASHLPIPAYSVPETESYTYGPWHMLSRVHFRLGAWEAAKYAAKKALNLNPPPIEWLEQIIACDPAGGKPEPLPPEWQEWLAHNLQRGVPKHSLIRTLEEKHFTPAHIITGLREADGKKAGEII